MSDVIQLQSSALVFLSPSNLFRDHGKKARRAAVSVHEACSFGF